MWRSPRCGSEHGGAQAAARNTRHDRPPAPPPAQNFTTDNPVGAGNLTREWRVGVDFKIKAGKTDKPVIVPARSEGAGARRCARRRHERVRGRRGNIRKPAVLRPRVLPRSNAPSRGESVPVHRERGPAFGWRNRIAGEHFVNEALQIEIRQFCHRRAEAGLRFSLRIGVGDPSSFGKISSP